MVFLGIWYGIGYCPITDWQWEVKEKLGERNIPENFVEYIVEKTFNRDFDAGFINFLTAVGFALAALASVYANFILPRVKKRRRA